MTLSREPEWDEHEQALRVAYVRYQHNLCASGHYLPDSAGPESEGGYTGRVRLCHACVAIGQKADAMKEHPHRGALLYGAERGVGRRGPS